MVSPWISLSFTNFPSCFLSGTMLHFHTEMQALHSLNKQPLFSIRKKPLLIQQLATFPKLKPPMSLSDSYQQPHILCLHSPRHLDMQTLSLFLLHYITCQLALSYPIIPSQLLLEKIQEKCQLTFTKAHLQWSHFLHCTHKSELSLTLNSQIPHC